MKQHDPYSTMLIPFWSWQEKTQDVRNVLNKYREDDNIKFHLPLIDSYLSICNCIISASDIEITPKCIPINKIQSFEQAERRIFMSATLADDSVFVTSLGLKTTELSNIITPDKASDIGDRLLLFPQVINKKLSDVDIKTILKSLSQEYNVVVIVPSYKRKDFWEDEADLIMDYQTIYDGGSRAGCKGSAAGELQKQADVRMQPADAAFLGGNAPAAAGRNALGGSEDAEERK